jgi:hypothetical protein
MGDARWRRLTEERAGTAKSVFHFDVQGSVAKSTHAGIPWLRFIRQRLGQRIHFLPFDGWEIPPGRSANRRGLSGRPARRLQHRGLAFARRQGWQPRSVPETRPDARRAVAQVDGWIIGRSRLHPCGQGDGPNKSAASRRREVGLLSGRGGFCRFGKLWRNSHICGEFLSRRFYRPSLW